MKASRVCLAVRGALAGAIGLCITVPGAHASGFAIPESSIAGLGTANALVANPEEVGAVVYNPAAMAFHEHSSLSGGLMFFMPSLSVTTASGHHDSKGDDMIEIPAFQGVFKLGDRWNLGLSASAPFGLETVWPVGTFPQLSQAIPVGPGVTIPPGIFHPTQSKLELLMVTPTVAYKVSDNFSVSAGLDYYDARKLVFNTGLVDLRGSGADWGWNMAAMYNAGPLTVGASYHSEVTVGLDGTFTLYGSPTVDVLADMDLPSRLQVGARYAFNDKIAAEIDWTRTNWSHFKDIFVTAVANGAAMTRSENQWKDANAYRLGLTYNLSDATQLRFGYTYDETGQTADYFSARIPDADRQLFSIGLAHEFGSGWEVEAGYMYVLFDDHSYRAGRPFNPAERDPNGTAALNGDYEADVHIFGLGVSKTFL